MSCAQEMLGKALVSVRRCFSWLISLIGDVEKTPRECTKGLGVSHLLFDCQVNQIPTICMLSHTYTLVAVDLVSEQVGADTISAVVISSPDK